MPYVVTATKNPESKTGQMDEFLLSSLEMNKDESFRVTRPVDYWTAQQIERAILYGKYLAKKEIQNALRIEP